MRFALWLMTSYLAINLIGGLIVFLISASFAFADVSTKTVNASVTWHAVGKPGFLNIDGKGGSTAGTLTMDGGKVSGSLSCNLSDFTTGIPLRDEHMKEKYLLTSQYPKAVLTLDPTTVPSDGSEFPWAGQLTLKGVTKPVSGKATSQKDGLLKATFTIGLDDYGIGVPIYLGVTVAKDVSVTVMGIVK